MRFLYTLRHNRRSEILSYIRRAGPNGDFIARKISAHAMNIFMIKNFEWSYFTQFFYIGTITTVTIFLNLKKSVLPKITDPAHKTQCVHRVNIFQAQIRHVYLIKFTQTDWLLSNFWIGMNETNLTQHARSTDVNGCYENFEKKRGNLLRTTSFYSSSCCVKILFNIIMVYVIAALITEALKYELENWWGVTLTFQYINN